MATIDKQPESSTSPDDTSKNLDTKSVEAITRLLESQNVHQGKSTIKKVAVSFENLTVTIPAVTNTTYVKTLPRAILNTFGPDQFNFVKSIFPHSNGKSASGSRQLLSDFTGLIEPGEMLLVLGRPGSGCSTFLRTAANRSKLSVSGDLRYGSKPAKDFAKTHSRETIYLPEEDKHIASLSVRQTIRFALQMSVPKQKDVKVDLNALTETIASIFGLAHALDTPVGGSFSPGVSGGERKRVSIAEVLAAGSSVQCFDNSTRGLDSSTALDFVKALRILTDLGGKTTMATLYQAGEELYSKFDKVLLIDEGQEVFFGRTDQARGYFEALGYIPVEGQTTAEFLTSVTDATERSFRPGSAASKIDTPQALALAFRQSSEYADLRNHIHSLQSIPETTDELLPTTAFNLSFVSQIIHCLYREYQLVFNQRRVHYVKWITTLILVFACGSVYYDITSDAQGAFTRGGILFFALILNGWMMFPELFDAHTNRSVLERQAHLHLYRPSAVAIARFVIDLPLVAFQHILFILPFYFLTRLQVDAGKFFFFYLTMYLSTINFSNLLRLFAYYVGTLDDTFRYGGFSCTVLLLFAGFLIPAKDMRPYFGWLHWINPMYYAFENLFVNEFSGLTIACSGGNLIPSGNNFDPRYQTCTLPGSVPGATSVSGAAYIEAYGFSFAHRWRNIGILCGIASAYLVAGAIGSEIMNFASQGGNPVVFAKSKKPRHQPANTDVEKSASISSTSSPGFVSEKGVSVGSAALTWQNLQVDIGEKRILKNISGYVKRGQLTALCGASGAGKTTLLSALSQTNFYGQLEGEVLFENQKPGADFKKTTGFAQQNDLHDGTQTVREALTFSALLRQPRSFTKAEKLAHVENVLHALDLQSYANALIGNEDTGGLGVEILKRVTIAVELAARPEILFADEPTSGLDSQGATHTIEYLRKLAHEGGNAVLVTVHQPSALLFSQFDNLLALSSNGEQLYFGSVPSALPYFERHGAICPPGHNPASFILETVGAGIHARESEKSSNWADTWRNSAEATALSDELDAARNQSVVESPASEASSEFNTSVFVQSQHLTVRMLKNQWRNTPYVYSKIWVHVISAFLVGFTFYQVGTGPQDLQNRYACFLQFYHVKRLLTYLYRAFSVYFILFLCNAIVNVILARYFFASLYWQYREGPSKTYGWKAFVTSSILSEMPAAILVTVLYFVIWYFPSGLPTSEAGYIFLVLLTYEVFQVLLGLFMMALSPDLGFAGNVLVFIVCTCNWFNGIIVPYDQIQVFWRYWVSNSCLPDQPIF